MRPSHLNVPTLFAIAMLSTLAVPTDTFAQSGSPFGQLSGRWHGGGLIKYEDGSNERLTCRSAYSQKSGAGVLTLAIHCQSQNNKIDLKSDISYEGGHLTGHWSEHNFGLEGDVSGSATPNKFSVRISGQLQGSMTVSVNGATHNVSVSSGGPGFKNVSITFAKG